MSQVRELEKIGFVKVGKWYFNEKGQLSFVINKMEKERVLYAFVIESEVKYIGSCEERKTTFKERMKRYKYKQGTGTNKRIHEKIESVFSKGKEVKIFAFCPSKNFKFKDLNIDLVRGLEYPLIERFNPEWNKAGKKR